MYPFTHLNSDDHIEKFLDPRRHVGFGRHLVAHTYYPPGIDTYFATVLSGTDPMGERWAGSSFGVLMFYGLIN